MKRVLAMLGAVGVLAFVVFGTGASSHDASGDYLVRAEFRNAFSVIQGEDVKIAGVKVGKIKSLAVTKQKTAAVVLDITQPGFKDFRRDAECTIRPQSLIGEKFVECTPTQPRAADAKPLPELPTIPKGQPGAGQHLLPVSQTSRPIDIDLVNNILRLPYRERLTILLNEFGTALAGRGQDLRSIIRNADPALKQTDRVLAILASQNQTLRKLATDSDTVLAPLARDRSKVADFVVQANTVAQATAEKRTDLARGIQKLPGFLAQLTPTMQRLGSFSDQVTPVLRDLDSTAPQLNSLIRQTKPFVQSATPSLVTLGDASVTGRTALNKSRPVITQLNTLARTAQPVATNLREILESLHDTGGIERALDYIFYQAAAVNGFDQFGHYLRAQLVVNLCSTYATTLDPACSAKFAGSGASNDSQQRSTKAAIADGRSPDLAREDAVLRGQSPASVLAQDGSGSGSSKGTGSTGSTASGAAPLALPSQLLPGSGSSAAAKPTAAAPATTTGTTAAPTATTTGTTAAPTTTSADQGAGALLDYLLGGGGAGR